MYSHSDFVATKTISLSDNGKHTMEYIYILSILDTLNQLFRNLNFKKSQLFIEQKFALQLQFFTDEFESLCALKSKSNKRTV